MKTLPRPIIVKSKDWENLRANSKINFNGHAEINLPSGKVSEVSELTEALFQKKELVEPILLSSHPETVLEDPGILLHQTALPCSDEQTDSLKSRLTVATSREIYYVPVQNRFFVIDFVNLNTDGHWCSSGQRKNTRIQEIHPNVLTTIKDIDLVSITKKILLAKTSKELRKSTEYK